MPRVQSGGGRRERRGVCPAEGGLHRPQKCAANWLPAPSFVPADCYDRSLIVWPRILVGGDAVILYISRCMRAMSVDFDISFMPKKISVQAAVLCSLPLVNS